MQLGEGCQYFVLDLLFSGEDQQTDVRQALLTVFDLTAVEFDKQSDSLQHICLCL